MSVVTNVIVSGYAGCYSDPKLSPACRKVITALNEWLAKPVTKLNSEPVNSLGQLMPVDQYAGGTRAMETNLWLGAFNYMPIGEFITVYQRAVASIQGDSTLPQMLMKRQDDDKFHEVPNKPDYRMWSYLGVDRDINQELKNVDERI